MDAVEHGQAFTVTRDGHQIGELIPLRRRRRFVSRTEFATTPDDFVGLEQLLTVAPLRRPRIAP